MILMLRKEILLTFVREMLEYLFPSAWARGWRTSRLELKPQIQGQDLSCFVSVDDA